MSELDANVIVNGQKAIATVAQTGTVVQDGGAIDATSVIQTESGPQKVVKVMDVNGGGGGGGTSDYEQLENKPQINSVTLTGNKTGSDLGLLSNTATKTSSLTIQGTASSVNNSINIGTSSYVTVGGAVAIGKSCSASSNAVGIGQNAGATGNMSIAIGGYGTTANQARGIAIGGYECRCYAESAIQLGYGSNSVANQFQVYSYPMLDGNTGKIPTDRMTKVIELTTTSVELASDNIYNGAELASVTFTLPATVPVNFTAQLNFTSGTTATVLTAPNTINFDGDDCSGGVFTPVASKRYQVLIDNDGVNTNGYVIGR